MIEMKDRVPGAGKANRKKITFEDDDSIRYAKVEYADEPVEEGTPINKATMDDRCFHVGMILMWSGSIDTIPNGWALCDGTNETPDLRNRFIVGAGSGYEVGNTGGSNSVTLTISQIPSHTHEGTTDESGEHRHESVTSKSQGNEKATYGNNKIIDGYTGYAGEHTHTFTTSSTGSGSSHENRPPYYALAYIMKI